MKNHKGILAVLVFVLMVMCGYFVYKCYYDNLILYSGDLKVITEEDYEVFSPMDPIDQEAYEQSLFNKDIDCEYNYFTIQALYKKGLDYYLVKELGLKEIDDELKKKVVDLDLVKTTDDIYINSSMMGLDFICLRNYVHVERLDDKSIQFLLDKLKRQDFEVDDELYTLIDKTYEITLPFNDDGYVEEYLSEKCLAEYGPGYAIVDIGSLVLTIHADLADQVVRPDIDSTIKLMEGYSKNIHWNKEMKIRVLNLLDGMNIYRFEYEDWERM